MSQPIDAQHYATELNNANAPGSNQSYESVAQAEVRQIRLDYGSKPSEYSAAIQAVENKLNGPALQAFGFAAAQELLQQFPKDVAPFLAPISQATNPTGPRNIDENNVVETYQDGSSRGYHYDKDPNTGERLLTAVNETDKNGISRKLARQPDGTWAAGQTSNAYGQAFAPGENGTAVTKVDEPPKPGSGISVGSTLDGRNNGNGELALTPRDEVTPPNPDTQTFATPATAGDSTPKVNPDGSTTVQHGDQNADGWTTTTQKDGSTTVHYGRQPGDGSKDFHYDQTTGKWTGPGLPPDGRKDVSFDQNGATHTEPNGIQGHPGPITVVDHPNGLVVYYRQKDGGCGGGTPELEAIRYEQNAYTLDRRREGPKGNEVWYLDVNGEHWKQPNGVECDPKLDGDRVTYGGDSSNPGAHVLGTETPAKPPAEPPAKCGGE